MAEDHLASMNECPDCASMNIVHSTMRDQIICRDCGLVFEPLAPMVKKKPVKVAKPSPARRTKAKKVKTRAAPKKVKAKKSREPAKKSRKPVKKAKKPKKKKKFGWF